MSWSAEPAPPTAGPAPRITVLAGGVGGARFVRGLRHHLDTAGLQASTITVVVNTGDDITMHGLRICPDIDTMLYTLGGGVDEERGWGRATDTHTVQEELSAYAGAPPWFTLSDRDLGTHITRTQWLAQGHTLSAVTRRLSERWQLPSRRITVLPMSDLPAETQVVVADGGQERTIHFQEWWVRHRAALEARRFVTMPGSQAAPGVLAAIRDADMVLLPPSNPVVSIGTIVNLPGVRELLRQTPAPVVGVSPLIGGRPVRGHADTCLLAVAAEPTAAGVAAMYEDFLDGWLVDPVDADTHARHATVQVYEAPLLMTGVHAAARIAAAALQLSASLRGQRPSQLAQRGAAV